MAKFARLEWRRRTILGIATVRRMDAIIDIDAPATWPEDVKAWATDVTKSLAVSSPYTLDLPLFLDEREDEFRSLLRGRKLLAFHCTRLLNHEVAAIREEGLRQLSEALVSARIEAAHEYLSQDEREVLAARHCFATGSQANREGQVCLVLGRTAFDEEPHGCTPLLSTWGGEGIYMGLSEDRHVVLRLGRPAIVVTAIDLSVSHKVSPSFPSLSKLFAGTLAGTEQRWADVFLRSSIPPTDIMDIWQPGDSNYDRHDELPRS
jgi:hypothetical protein